MPLGGGVSLALATAPGLLQIGQGIFQRRAARRVKYQDLTPEPFKEEMAASRLSANSQRMPGEGAAIDRINAGVANSYNNAVQSGTGSAGILASLGRFDANRNSALVGLADRAGQFRLGQQNRLTQNLRQAANYQQQSRDAFNRQKAGLEQAGQTNIFGGVSTIAGAGITGLTGGFQAMKGVNNQLANGESLKGSGDYRLGMSMDDPNWSQSWNNGYMNKNYNMFGLPIMPGSKSYKPQ